MVDPTSGDLLALPRDTTQLAAPFRMSQFGSFRMHECRGGAVGGTWLAAGAS